MIAQIFIAVFGVTAVWLSQDSRIERRKWASIFGLLGQPFWFYAAWTTEQWGIFVLSIMYTISWLRGFKQHWM
jgi:hypothetical protein